MSGTIRARVKGGTLEPLEKLDLPEGKEVLITIVAASPEPDFEAFRRSTGGWRGTVDADALIRNIYADRWIFTRAEPRL
ncbi:MAG: antitoxin family protein [Acidobacteria bacterium]|nr:antitoxin family protein [Acidobacteriota bacterium]